NLIFASNWRKPEICFNDAINNDIVILSNAESCLAPSAFIGAYLGTSPVDAPGQGGRGNRDRQWRLLRNEVARLQFAVKTPKFL
ncbi:MAG: hypothetical protein K2Y51_10235, partial [Gammaproteobacteria bacterium]|nr:hypothetical protein [Gammaproteobacteria bacterium]